MLQIISLLLLSWFILWVFEKKNLLVLGLTPTSKRLKYFTILFIVSSFLSATTFFLKMYFAKEVYTISETLTTKSILLETWYQFRSVLTEELFCRGALLYLLIKKIGQNKAIITSSVIFAALHWLNAGVWGNLSQMTIIFVFTFLMGLLLAYAYAKTFSLLIPFAIHFGWNLTQNYIFPDTATGNHIFILAEPPPTVTISYLAFFTMLFLPKIAVLLVNYHIIKKYPQAKVL
ncbi:MAG: CPBP family intramembrane metalloprotease [Saprospiraceae bacterium]|nr:CPBP family intramembrane metalloprotease [Saprospiraceae bacterium]